MPLSRQRKLKRKRGLLHCLVAAKQPVRYHPIAVARKASKRAGVFLGMSDPAPLSSGFPADLTAAYPQAELAWAVLEASLTGLALYAPLWDEQGRLVDFRIDLLNPAAQRILQQPARPAGTYLQHYPHTLATGVFAFHRDAFESGTPAQLSVNYQGDGLDNYFHLSARRVGQGLLVSFTDTADAARTEVELALRASQTQEQAARAEAERQRNQFQALVDQAPVALGFFEGQELRVTAANQQMCAVWGHAADQVLHRPLIEGVPELQGQGFDDLLRQVMATEVPVVGTETPARMLRDGQLTTTYYDFVYKPFYNAQGEVQGVIDVAVDVTARVVARQQLQELTTELLAANQELEAVTILAEQARAEADLQRQQLRNVLEQAPAMICIFDGPQHTFQLVNPPYQALVGDRPLVGKPIAEAMPELAGHPIFGLLDQVYRTGETYYANEMLVQLNHDNQKRRKLQERYYNFIYQARHNLAGAIDGIFVFAYDVTTQVLARHEVQNLNEELAAINEELHASNEEYLTTNTALQEAQQALQQFNHELEGRVAERTGQLVAARAEAERQRARLAQLFTQAPAAICILDGPDLVYELVNPGYQALFPGRELLGKPILAALPEIADNQVYATLRRVYDTGQTHEEQALLVPLARPTDGVLEDRYFRYIQQARYAADGQIDGVLVFAFEITAQVQAHQQAEALQAQVLLATQRQVQARETLYEVFAMTPAAICIQRGPEHRYEYANQAYLDFFPGRTIIGQTVAEALPETVTSGVVALLDHVYQTGETYYGNELPLQIAQPDGSLRKMYFTFTYQAYRENGEIVGISTFAYNVVEQVLARQQVQHLNEELAASNEELNESNNQLTRTNVDLDNFIYTASHDLKAPIANIEGLLLALRRELPAAGQVGEVPTLLQLMEHAIERFGRTISHLTDVSRLQKAHAQPATYISLAPVVQEVQLDLAPLLAQTGARLLVNVPENTLLLFSEKNLRSVVYNLLSNALKYRHPDRVPEVRVAYRPEAKYQVLEVQDNGLGLDLTQGQEKLFAMFQRLHTHVEGSGIGLYMVKKMVENVGGRIEVQSKLDQGTTFSIYFPR